MTASQYVNPNATTYTKFAALVVPHTEWYHNDKSMQCCGVQ